MLHSLSFQILLALALISALASLPARSAHAWTVTQAIEETSTFQYKFRSRLSQKVLDVDLDLASRSEQGGPRVQLYEDHDGLNQRWTIHYVRSEWTTLGIYANLSWKIDSTVDGSVLGIQGLSSDDHSSIRISDDRDDGHQQWKLIPTGDGFFKVASAAAPSKVLDVRGGLTSDHAQVQLFEDNGGFNQQWEVMIVRVPQLNFSFQSKSSHMVLDLPFGLAQDGVQVQQHVANGGANQSWQLVSTNDGYFFMRCVCHTANDDRVLEVGGASLADHAPIQTGWITGGYHQQWKVVLVEAPTPAVKMVSRLSGKVMDVWSASTDQGAGIQQYTDHGGPNQTWYLGFDVLPDFATPQAPEDLPRPTYPNPDPPVPDGF